MVIVKEVSGYCAANYKPGDFFIFDSFFIEPQMPVKICLHALSAMQNMLYGLAHGIYPEKLGAIQEDSYYVHCPDPGEPYTRGGSVLFELKVQR